ncbi:unnamed protein product [Darwinula stevensoni]|uniref:Cleavage and polyadenylation specificity factor subunit 6 n=1 Tax=Darwinula stevensoni TaxID=69355 RepID=A0A7R8XE29_9CRUS|nr:unnamed protein product [Darwinula stevensoni]CAG0893863.1 unnamed protein product [Darwinula stevensoni]
MDGLTKTWYSHLWKKSRSKVFPLGDRCRDRGGRHSSSITLGSWLFSGRSGSIHTCLGLGLWISAVTLRISCKGGGRSGKKRMASATAIDEPSVDIDLYSDDIGDDFIKDEGGSGGDAVDLYDDVIAAPSSIKTEDIGKSTSNGPSPNRTRDVDTIYHPGYQGRRLQVCIGNLTWWTTDQDIEDAVRGVGVNDFVEVKFYENRANGQSKGFCVVAVASEQSVRLIMERLPKKELHGMEPVVTPYNKQALSQFEAQSRARPLPQMQGPGIPRMGGPPLMSGAPRSLMGSPRVPPHPRIPPPPVAPPPLGPPLRPPPPGAPPPSGRPTVSAPPLPFPPSKFSIYYSSSFGKVKKEQAASAAPPPSLLGAIPPPRTIPPPSVSAPPPLHTSRPPPNVGVPPPLPLPGLLPPADTRAPPPRTADWARAAMSAAPPLMPGPPPTLPPAPHVNPAFFPSTSLPPPGFPPIAQSSYERRDSGPSMSEAEFEEIMNRNRTVSSSAIARAVADAAAGEFASAIETLVTAISLIKQSKVAHDDRCKIVISSLQDTLHGIEAKSYGSSRRSRDRSRSRERERRRRRHERSRSPRDYRERSRERYERDFHERSRSRERSRERDRYYDDRYRERERDRDREMRDMREREREVREREREREREPRVAPPPPERERERERDRREESSHRSSRH